MNVNNLRKRPLGITIAVILADICALLRLIRCIVVIVATFSTASRVPASARVMIVGISVFWGTIAVGILSVGHFLWRGANWARITFIVILLASMILTIVGILLWDVDVESMISITIILVCILMLNSASAEAYCPPAEVQGIPARIAVAGIVNVCYGTLGYLTLAFPTLLAWAIAASRSSKAVVFNMRMHMIGSIDTSLLLLLQMGIATVLTTCWLLCVCFVISGIGILLMKEWARRMTCVAAGAMVICMLVLLTTVLCAEVAEVRLLVVKLGSSHAALLSAMVALALAWPMTVNFLLSTTRTKAQFVRSIVPEELGKPKGPEDTQALARVRRQERKELLLVCSGIIAFFAIVALFATALPGVRWRAAPHKQVPPALKHPTALIRQGKHEEAIPLLLDALISTDFLTRQAAADALVELGETAIPALGDALARGYNYGGIFDMVLIKMGPAAIGAYTEGLKSKNASMRRMIMLRIAQMGAHGIPGLREALKCNDQIIQYQAIEALRKAGAPAVPVLKEAVENSDLYIRTRAITALWEIAAYDTAAVEVLSEVLQDQSGKFLIHYAAEAGNADAIEKFIKEGDNPNAKDASGNTPLLLVVEKMISIGRRGENYLRYKKAADILIANGADVNATGKFNRTLLERARALGREDIVQFLVVEGAKTHFNRHIYFKLPLEGVRFHWNFFNRDAYLGGHLILRIMDKDGFPVEVTVFKDGKVGDDWKVMGEDSRTPTSGGAYFGFVSSKLYPTTKGDDVEIELHVIEHLPGGWGSTDRGILPKGIYKVKGKINMVSNEPQALTIEGRQIGTPGWTAFLKWDTAWKLLRSQE